MLRSVKASAQINQQLVSCLRVALEQRTLELPVASRFAETVAGEEGEEDTPTARKLTLPEKAVYLESDALPVSYTHLDVYKRQELRNRGRVVDESRGRRKCGCDAQYGRML